MADITIPPHMKFSGMMAGGKSYHDIDVDVLKSALQKYVRRGMFSNALSCVYELDLFQELRGTETQDRALKALRTNVFNRLLIISVEDIGIGAPIMPLLVSKLSADYAIGDDALRRRTLYILVKNLCNAKKSRETSHIRCVYSQVPNSDRYDALREQYPHIYNFDIGMDTNRGFITYFDQGGDACFFYLFKAWYVTEKPSSVLPLLKHVMDRVSHPIKKRVMEILHEWMKGNSFKEIIIFAIQIVLLALRKDLVFEQDWDMEGEYLPSFEAHLSTPLHIHDYCIDKHTRLGKRMGKDLKDFANEGSYVENEDPHTNMEYKQIYIQFRQSHVEMKKSVNTPSQCEGMTKAGSRCKKMGTNLMDGHSFCNIHCNIPKVEEKATLNFKITHTITEENLRTLYQQPRGQLMTGKHKKQTFIPVEGRYKGYVIKGPWKAQDIARLNTMVERMQMGKKYNVPFLPFIIATGADGNGYTIYNNVATTEPSSWSIQVQQDPYVSTPWEEGPHEVKILDRASMGITQLHKLPDSEQMRIMFGEPFLFKAFILLAIMRVGDVGPWNVIVVGGKPWVIDYEENTSRKTFDTVDHFFAKKADKYHCLLTTGIRNNKERINNFIREVDAGGDFNTNEEWMNIKSVISSM